MHSFGVWRTVHPMSYSNRIFIYGPVALLVLVVVLYSVFWRVQADMLAAKLDSSNGGEVIPGVVFTFAEKSINGYPFRLDVVLSGVTFANRGPDGETAWRTEKLAMHTMSYRSNLYVFEAAGLQSFAQPGARGKAPRVTYVTPAIARASAVLREGRLARLDLDLWQAEGKDATPPADPKKTFSASRAQLHLLNRANDTIDVAVKIEGANLGEGYGPKLGSAIPLFDLRGKLVQSEELGDLEQGLKSLSEAVEQWRQKGGTLAVENLSLDWAGVKTDLSGTLGLDAAHRLSGVLLGKFDAASLVGALTGGRLSLSTGNNASATLSLRFKDGDVQLGTN
jgi:hypothetical protein